MAFNADNLRELFAGELTAGSGAKMIQLKNWAVLELTEAEAAIDLHLCTCPTICRRELPPELAMSQLWRPTPDWQMESAAQRFLHRVCDPVVVRHEVFIRRQRPEKFRKPALPHQVDQGVVNIVPIRRRERMILHVLGRVCMSLGQLYLPGCFYDVSSYYAL